MDALLAENWLIKTSLSNSLYEGLSGTSSWSPLNALFGSSSISNDSLASLAQQYATDQAQISGFGQLLAAVSAFQTTVQPLTLPQAISPAQVTSSNASVATASSEAASPSGTYAVTVSSLAQGQAVTSQAYADPNATIIGSGTLTIQLGTYDASTHTFTAGSTPAASIAVTNGSVTSIASAINGATTGVIANVIQDGSGYHLMLTSTNTGAANAFSVSVADADGTNTDLTGLSQLAFDPIAAVGAGQNLTLTQAAQDATFSINGAMATSASNTGVSVAPGTTLSLLQAGNTTVTVSPNLTAVQTAAQGLASAVTTLQSTLTALDGPTGRLATDPLAAQFQQALTAVVTQPFTNKGSFSSLTQIGITLQPDGAVTVDQQAVQAALSQDPASTVGLLQQAAQALFTVADTYGGPGGPMSTASQALQQAQYLLQSLAGGALSDSGQPSGASTPFGNLAPQTLQWQVDQLLLREIAHISLPPSTVSLYA